MLFGAMLIDAFHAAFENAVITLQRVSVHVTTAVFSSAMINEFVAPAGFSFMCIMASFVGHNGGFFRDVGAKNWNQMCGCSASNMKAANLAAALDKRKNSVLVR